jgi:hypothetical protein
MFAEKIQEKIENTDENTSFQLSIAASYTRTHYLVCDMILDGDLVEASVLIRKQLEAVARLNELDSKPLSKLLKKTPNVSNVLNKSSGKIYGILSEVAHSSSHRIANLLTIFEDGERCGPSTTPVYSEHSRGAWDTMVFIDIYFLFWISKKLETWYPEIELEEHKKLLVTTFLMAKDKEIIQVEYDSDGDPNA